MKTDVLGVKIDDVNIEQAVAQIEKWICPDPRQSRDRGSSMNEIHRENTGNHYVVTPNPEMVVAAQKDLSFKKILNDADLSIPDGVGLKLSGKIKNTVSGTDLMERLVKLAAEKGFVTGFLGGKVGVAEKTAECLKKKYPGLKVGFAGNGGEVDNDGRIKEKDLRFKNNDLRIKNHKSSIINHQSLPPSDILFVAFGHIKQEKWIANNLDNIPVKLAMGVGGAFDYLSGRVPRAPAWLRNLGFEWLFRLLIQPTRIKRQIALVKYLWLLVIK